MGVDGREAGRYTIVPAQDGVGTTSSHVRSILNALPALVGYWDASLHNVMANDAYLEFFGVTPEQMRGMHVRDLLGDELYALNAPFMQRALAGEAQLFDRAIPDPRGRTRYTQTSYLPDVVNGEVRGFFVMVTDITPRRQVEIALEASERLQRTLLEQLSECVVLQIPGERILRTNRAATLLLGIVEGDGDGDMFAQTPGLCMFHADGRPLTPDESPSRAALANEGVQRNVIHLMGGHVGDRWVRVNSVALDHDIDGARQRLVLLTFADVTVEKQTELALSELVAVQRIILDSLDECVVLHDLDAGVIRANVSATVVLGVAPGPESFVAQLTRTVDSYEADGNSLDALDSPTRRALRSGVIEPERILEYRRADGSSRWMSCNALALPVPVSGAAHPVLLTMVDITEKRTVQLLLDQERQLLEASFDSVNSGVLAVDLSLHVLHVNRAFCTLVGADVAPADSMAAHMPGYALTDSHGAAVPPVSRPLAIALTGRRLIDEPYRLIRADGSEFDILASATPIHNHSTIVGAVLTVNDITELRQAERDLRILATTDPLTGLFNRRQLLTELDLAIARHKRTPERLGVLFLDLDGFKAINDTLGHEAGDELLAAAAQRVSNTLRPGDIIARYGGDEFVVVIENLNHPRDTQHLADRIEQVLAQPFQLAAGTAHIGGSVGVAGINDGDTADTVLAHADRVMYQRKHHRNTNKDTATAPVP